MKTLLLSACVLAFGLVQAKAEDKELALPTDQKFIAKAIECTIAEVKFAETALETTSNPEVKKLAQTIKDDHNICLKQLMVQADKLKLSVVEGLSKEHKEDKDRLSKFEGNEFDTEYVRGVIERHEKMNQRSNGQIKNGKDQEITTACKEAMTKIKGHLEAARKVQTNLKK